nr:trihelix transcription factor ASIL2-like [Tanacetum cinerariifolium]
MENMGGYLSVHFSQEFDMVGEIMGLSKGNGEEIRKCYMNFLEILTSHFKTARAPRQGNMDTMLEPSKRDRECLGYHQGKIGEDGVDLRSATRQQKLELEKVRLNFQRELELHKKVVLERVHAELAIIRERDDEDANSVDNRSRLA